ncbi:MAG: Uma2 family endonuclease [Emticicia sp.]|uniref:Uma2 family endonuclease n=1 Tax=Emticicia sp. TaxID=1930953 RepID=UPI003BA820BF
MGEAALKYRYSIKDYLEMEANSLEKLEYHNGEILAMTGETLNHGLLSNSVGASLINAIRKKGKSCRTYSSDAKIAISEEKFVYSDSFIVCGKIETFPEMPQAAKNPILIVEVLSDSTALYDRQDKFQAYQTIDSFREYVLVSQNEILVEVFFKPENAVFWQYRSYNKLEDIIELKSVDVEISLNDIYLDWELLP